MEKADELEKRLGGCAAISDGGLAGKRLALGHCGGSVAPLRQRRERSDFVFDIVRPCVVRLTPSRTSKSNSINPMSHPSDA